jgi:two-component system, NarL family, nitrate/nitrite response regulator NarL
MSSTAESDAVTVLVVEDHALFRQAVCRILSKEPRINVVGVAESGEQGVSYAKERLPQIVLTDVRMPGLKGPDVTRAIKEALPGTEVVALTVSEEQEDLLEILRAGARGYVVKAVAQSEVVPAVLAAARGESWLSPKIAGKLIAEFTQLPSTAVRTALREHAYLTPREQSVLAHLAQGMTNREIAGRLDIAETTVKTHLRNILEKLHARNRLEAAAMALKLGLVAERVDDAG